MEKCANCNLCFRNKWFLERHVSRVRPCVKKVEESILQNPKINSNNLSNTSINSSNTSINSSNTSIDLSNTSINSSKCEFCLNSFYNKYTKNKHQLICKYRDDPVRLLEIKVGIIPPETFVKTECRFCNHDLLRIDNLHRHFKVCKERKEYHEKLEKRENESKQIINNNNQITNNNTTNNNITNNQNNFNGPVIINLIGNETNAHINLENVLNNLLRLQNKHGDDHIYIQAGEMVVSYDDLLRKIPENQNVIVPNFKSPYVEVKTKTGWEKKETDDVLNETFKNSAKLLYDSEESIKKNNQKVFKEVGKFAKIGFKHENADRESVYTGQKKKIQTLYKINLLKNRKTE